MSIMRNFLVLTICELFAVSKQSIDGITYRDNFDFEERYRDKHYCDPLYWHPLHMPDYCTQMYEKLIRSRLHDRSKQLRQRLVKSDSSNSCDDSNESCSRSSSETESFGSSAYNPYGINAFDPFGVNIFDSYNLYNPYDFTKRTSNNRNSKLNFVGELTINYKTNGKPYSYPDWIPPYLRMLDMVKKDVMNQPAAPIIKMIPSVGLAAVYRQPVSKKTEDVIKTIAKAYADAAQETYQEADKLFSIATAPPIPKDHTTQSIINEKGIKLNQELQDNIKNKILNLVKPIKQMFFGNKNNTSNPTKRPVSPNDGKKKVITKKFENEDMVAYVQEKKFG